MRDQTVAATVARAWMEFAASRGADRKLLSERSGIDLAELQNGDSRIPFASYVSLVRAGKDLCNDPAFALHFGESVEGGEMLFPCLSDALSRTMAESIAQLNRSAPAAADAASDERYQFVRDGEGLWIVDTSENGFPESTEANVARSICMARRLFPGMAFMKAVHFTHAEPAYRAEYDRIIQMPIVFGSHHNALLTDPAWLEQRPPASSRYVYEIIKARAESLLERLEDSDSTKRQVETLLENLLHTGDVGVDTIARKLGLSRQTLFRKLRTDGVTFKQVLEQLRHKLAIEYLAGKKMSVNETAYLIGFSDATAFSRAFKRWTGKSPSTIASPRQTDPN